MSWQDTLRAVGLALARRIAPAALLALLAALTDVGLLDGALYDAVAELVGQ